MIPRRPRRQVTRELQIVERLDRSVLFAPPSGAGKPIALPKGEITIKPADRFGWHDVTMPDWLARDRGLK